MENQPFPTLSVISDRSELSGIGITGREFVIAVAEGGLPDEAGDKQPQQPMGHVTMRGPGLSRMT
jgi:hypothetical protein